MIIDDAHRVAFVHIPKCGGVSVKQQLAPHDSYDGYFRRKDVHPDLGPIHYGHIPLYFLKRHFPAEFDKVAGYSSFALLRDPHARFASATFQRLEEFKGVPALQITGEAAIAEAREVMRWLASQERFCDLEYIHFSRQADYVRLDGRDVVANVFALEDMAAFGAALRAACGVAFDPERRENANFASSRLSALRRLKPIYERLTTWETRRRLLRWMQRTKVQSPASLYAAFRRDREISAFVEDYYAADFELRRRALEPPVAQGARQTAAPAGAAA